jgi:hypothetical protein
MCHDQHQSGRGCAAHGHLVAHGQHPSPASISSPLILSAANDWSVTEAGILKVSGAIGGSNGPMTIVWVPSKALDKWLPGHTARRDLIGEIADALQARHIKLAIYPHPSATQ